MNTVLSTFWLPGSVSTCIWMTWTTDSLITWKGTSVPSPNSSSTEYPFPPFLITADINHLKSFAHFIWVIFSDEEWLSLCLQLSPHNAKETEKKVLDTWWKVTFFQICFSVICLTDSPNKLTCPCQSTLRKEAYYPPYLEAVSTWGLAG